ncbi:hypothetical protein HOLleu_16142 [Holothuria leucospilota]|uniref:Uncharacterized protein n=1 Tax=Holothuria leucospilota TaxID=206669 RepID=A0A9Q1HAX8_HOLLE|nr:hypothetical protein HOLleu_16142 [Holothuria leucospilota]
MITSFSIVQEISGDLDFWHNDDELLDIEKRQDWSSFKKKHVIVAPTIRQDDNYWDCTACKRLRSKYGRPKQTFIRVDKESDIVNTFKGKQKCLIPPKRYAKSKDALDIVEMVWNIHDRKYDVSYPSPAHVCVALDNSGMPVHYKGTE